LDNSTGTYEEVWQAPTQWRRQAKLGNVSVTESQNGDHTYRKIEGSAFSPRQIDAFLDELDGHFPRTDGSLIEGDWGQSAVQLNGVDLVRVARGKVDANNQPISGQAYWFDSVGLLRVAYVAPRVSIYSEFSDWNGKHVPHKIEVAESSKTLFRVSIDKLESQFLLPDSVFVVQGAKVEKIGDSDDYRGPVLVQPSPIYKPKPADPHTGHGKVIVDVQLDPRGHVRTAEIRQSAGKDLDAAAIQAAMRWEFTPMLIRGHAAPGHAVIEFKFND
jgi:TonB family protein